MTAEPPWAPVEAVTLRKNAAAVEAAPFSAAVAAVVNLAGGQEVARVVVAKVVVARAEAARAAVAKVEAAKVEAAKVEAAKVEAAKVEAAKAEAVEARTDPCLP